MSATTVCPMCKSTKLEFQGKSENRLVAICQRCGHKFQVSWVDSRPAREVAATTAREEGYLDERKTT